MENKFGSLEKWLEWLVNFDISQSISDGIDIEDEKKVSASPLPSFAIVRIYWRKLGSVDGISLLR